MSVAVSVARPQRDLWLLAAAGTVSAVGDGMTIVAVPLLAASVTGDPRVVSGLRIAASLPWLTLGLGAGAIADRVSRPRLMVVANLLRVGIVSGVAAVALHRLDRLWPVYLLVFALGTAQTLFDSAAQAFLPEIVDDDRLERGNSLLLSGQALAMTFLGPPLGALLFSWFPAAPFLVDAGTLAVSAALLLAIRTRRYAVTRAPARPGLRREITEAVRHIAARPLLRTFVVLVAVVNLAHGMMSGIMVLFAVKFLGLSNGGYSALISGESAGLLLGGLLARWAADRLGVWPTLRVSIGCTAVVPLLIGFTRTPWVVFALTVVDGVALMVWGVVAVSVRQRMVPAALLGRTMAVYRVASIGLMSVGAAAGGYLAGGLSMRAPFLIGGALATGTVALCWPMLSDEGRSNPRPSRRLPA